jgi:hypothetical protein
MGRRIVTILLIGFSTYFLLCIFLGIYKPWGQVFIFSEGLGDMYKFSGIADFKEEVHIKPNFKLEADKLADSQIIIIGDSFFTMIIDETNFSTVLQKKLKQNFFQADVTLSVSFPLEYLKSINYQKSEKPKYLVLETVERGVNFRAGQYNIVDEKFRNLEQPKFSVLNNIITDIKYFFLNNVISFQVISFIKTLRFKISGDVDPMIGTYSLNPLNLFYHEDIEAITQRKNKKIMNKTVESIHKLAIKLKNDYKYSLYHETAHIHLGYDNFIPKITEQLRKRNIPAPDIYTPFRNFIKKYPALPLYFKSDTHYNSRGREILTDVLTSLLKKIQEDKNFAAMAPVNFIPAPDLEEFNEQTYINAFKDVADAVRNGQFVSGYEHYVRFGRKENRLQNSEYIKEEDRRRIFTEENE